MRIESFDPVSSSECVLVILGTMPGKESLQQNKYYAHFDNLFWDIIIRVLQPEFSDHQIENLNYESKLNILLNNKIALWDVLKYCDREGNLDRNIKNEIKNDFERFFAQNVKIKTIIFNGKVAQKQFNNSFSDLAFHLDLKQRVLPSTSSSNRMNCFEKLKEWRIIKELNTKTT